MVKILIVSFHYYPDLCAGSFRSTALVAELKKIKNKNLSIDIITTMPNRYATYNLDALEYERIDNITIRRVILPKHKSGMRDQAKAFTYFSYVASKYIQGKKYDLVYATSSRLMTATLGAWLAKLSGAKLYLDIRDIFLETIVDVFPAKISKFIEPIFSLLEKWTFNRADHINIVSEGFTPYFKKRYPKQSLSYFTNGIDDEFYKFSQNINQNIDGLVTKKKILYAGNIGEGQGLHRIIPLLSARLDNYEFYVIGDGGRRKALEIALHETMNNNVTILDPCSRDILIKKYHEADILFLHLNDYNAFHKVLPSKLFEYAAMGKPILAGVAGYAADFIKKEIPNAAIFRPCDAEGAINVLGSLQLATEPREIFINKYRRSFIMTTMVEQMLTLLNI